MGTEADYLELLLSEHEWGQRFPSKTKTERKGRSLWKHFDRSSTVTPALKLSVKLGGRLWFSGVFYLDHPCDNEHLHGLGFPYNLLQYEHLNWVAFIYLSSDLRICSFKMSPFPCLPDSAFCVQIRQPPFVLRQRRGGDPAVWPRRRSVWQHVLVQTERRRGNTASHVFYRQPQDQTTEGKVEEGEAAVRGLDRFHSGALQSQYSLKITDHWQKMNWF